VARGQHVRAAQRGCSVVSQAIYGAGVGILEERPGWARVRTADDYTGWMPMAALKTGPAYPSGGWQR